MKSAEEWLNTAMVFAFDPALDDVGRKDAIRRIQADAMREAAIMVRRAPLDTHYDSDAGTINRVNMADTIADKAQQLEQNEQ